MAQQENQFKAVFRQFDLIDQRLPLVELLIADTQRLGHRVVAFILAGHQQRAEILLILHLIKPQPDQHTVIQRFKAAIGLG
ncbi:hypothetical protein D3C78_1137650 [compost metagenome]